MKLRLLDPRFKYIPAAHTNIGKTFAMWRRNYAKCWDDAHLENEERTKQAGNVKQLNKRTA